jgi:hypothetical protein
MLMLNELVPGVTGYDVQKVSVAEATALCTRLKRERTTRGASTSHFLSLLREVSQRNDTYTFKVTSRISKNENPYDIVLVSDNGSFACTEPTFAQLGMPGRHILAVFAAKYCVINVFHHFHPIYLRKTSEPAKNSARRPCDIAALQWQAKLDLGLAAPANFVRGSAPAVVRSTSWSWAIERARSRVQIDLYAEHADFNEQQSRHMPPQPQAGGRGGGGGRKRAANAEAEGAAAAAATAPAVRVFALPDGSGVEVAQPALPANRGQKSKRKRSWLEVAQGQGRSKRVR